MTPLQAIILGLVEGITEYLPVSSTGHLIIAASLLFGEQLNDPNTKANVDAFNIIIQGGAILAVLGLYFPRIVLMLNAIIKPKSESTAPGRRLLTNLTLAFLPAAILGVPLASHIERFLFHPIPVLTALALGGIWMIWIDRWRKQKLQHEQQSHQSNQQPSNPRFAQTIDQLTWKQAITIGIFQCVAMIPGTSRSMMTIVGGTIVGLKPKDAAEFSFLLGLPTLGGACLYKLYKNLAHAAETDTPNIFQALGVLPVTLGIAVAAIAAAIAVKWLVSFLNTHGLAPFGYYRLILVAVMATLIATGIVNF